MNSIEEILADRATFFIRLIALVEDCEHMNPVSIIGALEDVYVSFLIDNGVPVEVAINSIKEVYKKIKKNKKK